ncbi:androgen-induced gene 1 protein isoform X5 [Harpia harpyja]|uniref:androgen-induced gene 1 protein isoform X4 n=1 Tax=Aquila chrysaetos chrysaetos TaxID=223781 RepID=UPI0005D0B324|nr:androgen-induced gene 1 protein isoform X4 [Aquila chrysaetos chrysaetos]XP_050749668.1 androgen-induced gene 1 protein isoform X2 [Gymnogyps californianus]XP_052640525.1 androgen-induced gene 1 protein isoform X5 [Harpia harpyja]
MALVPCQVLRAAILLSYCSILCNYKAIDMPAHQTYGGSWKFLTFIDLVIQAVFFGICVLTDLSSLLTKGNDSQEQERQLKKLISLRDWVMAVLAFPVGVHTTVLPFVLIEMRTTHHQYPSRSCGLAAVCTFAVGYILWVCWIHHVTGVWVYPLLEHLSPGVKIIFFAAVTVIINIFYLVGEVLNNYIWDTQKCIEEGKEKPKLD